MFKSVFGTCMKSRFPSVLKRLLTEFSVII